MAEQEYTPTEAEIWARASAGAVASLRLTDQRSQAEATRGIERIKAEVRADERAKLQDRIEELEKNLSYEVEQKIKLADTLRDERAKRPDREQLARIQFEIDNVHQIHGETCLCGFKSSRSRSRTEHLTALFADAVLALEPEAREEPKLAEILARAEEVRQDDGWGIGGAWGDYGEVVVPLRILSYVIEGELDQKVASTDPGFALTYAEQVRRAEIAEVKLADAREEAGPALRIDEGGAHIYWADPVEGCWVAFKRVDCVGEEELPERRLPAPETREEPKHGLIEDYTAVQAPDWAKVSGKLDTREVTDTEVEAAARCPYCSKVVEVHREGWFYDHGNPEPCPGSGDRPEAAREVSRG